MNQLTPQQQSELLVAIDSFLQAQKLPGEVPMTWLALAELPWSAYDARRSHSAKIYGEISAFEFTSKWETYVGTNARP